MLTPESFAAKRKIIVSYFAPFGEMSSNNSNTIAHLVEKKLGSSDDIEIIMCPMSTQNNGLNITFHSPRNDLPRGDGMKSALKGSERSAYEQLNDCYQKNPDAQQVISLGSGACQMHVEAATYNAMSTSANKDYVDQNGNYIPTMQKIDENGPDVIPTDNVNAYALCEEQTDLKFHHNDERNLVRYSTGIGSYVCNNVAYNFEKSIQEHHYPVSYSFIHIPLDLGDAKKFGCDLDPYSDALKNKGLKLNEANFNQIISNHVSNFIKNKDFVINELMPQSIPQVNTANQTCSTSFSLSKQSLESIHAVVNNLKNHALKQTLQSPSMAECLRKHKLLQDRASAVYAKDFQ